MPVTSNGYSIGDKASARDDFEVRPLDFNVVEGLIYSLNNKIIGLNNLIVVATRDKSTYTLEILERLFNYIR